MHHSLEFESWILCIWPEYLNSGVPKIFKKKTFFFKTLFFRLCRSKENWHDKEWCLNCLFFQKRLFYRVICPFFLKLLYNNIQIPWIPPKKYLCFFMTTSSAYALDFKPGWSLVSIWNESTVQIGQTTVGQNSFPFWLHIFKGSIKIRLLLPFM